MRKVTATAIYKGNKLYSLSVLCRNSLIPIVRYDLTGVQPCEYNNFQALYTAVLNLLKSNGFYVDSYKEFGCRWYNIQFLNLENPVKLEKHGYKEVNKNA